MNLKAGRPVIYFVARPKLSNRSAGQANRKSCQCTSKRLLLPHCFHFNHLCFSRLSQE